MAYEFRLPDVGEGLTEGEIVKWRIKEGDRVEENQPLVNVLTDKAEVEIPSPKTGTILKLMAKEGQKVPVHSVLVEIVVEGEAGNGAAASGQSSKTTSAVTPAAKTPPPVTTSQPQQKAATVSATPAVRKLAQDLKVDLAAISGTGPGGRITEDDVKRATHSPAAVEAAGPEERVPFQGIRRRTAEKMALSARSIPHVTHLDEADVTDLLALRESLKGEAQKRDIKLTFLPFIIRALVKALKEFPSLNASLDEARSEIILKKYYNIGIAVSAQQQLFVPVVKDADKKDVWTLASEIAALSARARDNRLALNELQGGTFTLTNIGPIGGLYATPIINAPEAAILGIMKISQRPMAREGRIVARSMLNLSLSFDHRILDGAEAASFVNALIRSLENPRALT